MCYYYLKRLNHSQQCLTCRPTGESPCTSRPCASLQRKPAMHYHILHCDDLSGKTTETHWTHVHSLNLDIIIYLRFHGLIAKNAQTIGAAGISSRTRVQPIFWTKWNVRVSSIIAHSKWYWSQASRTASALRHIVEIARICRNWYARIYCKRGMIKQTHPEPSWSNFSKTSSISSRSSRVKPQCLDKSAWFDNWFQAMRHTRA